MIANSQIKASLLAIGRKVRLLSVRFLACPIPLARLRLLGTGVTVSVFGMRSGYRVHQGCVPSCYGDGMVTTVPTDRDKNYN